MIVNWNLSTIARYASPSTCAPSTPSASFFAHVKQESVYTVLLRFINTAYRGFTYTINNKRESYYFYIQEQYQARFGRGHVLDYGPGSLYCPEAQCFQIFLCKHRNAWAEVIHRGRRLPKSSYSMWVGNWISVALLKVFRRPPVCVLTFRRSLGMGPKAKLCPHM